MPADIYKSRGCLSPNTFVCEATKSSVNAPAISKNKLPITPCNKIGIGPATSAVNKGKRNSVFNIKNFVPLC